MSLHLFKLFNIFIGSYKVTRHIPLLKDVVTIYGAITEFQISCFQALDATLLY